MVSRSLVVGVGVVLMVAGCIDGESRGANEAQPSGPTTVEGIWVYESYTLGDGITHRVEAGVNAVRVPWMEVGVEEIIGNAGCNEFSGPYRLLDDRLTAAHMPKNAAWCGPEDGSLMTAELAWEAVLFQLAPVAVDIADGRMTLTHGDESLQFLAAASTPTTEPHVPEPQSQVGRLDCSPGFVREMRVPDEGQPPLDIAREADERVVSVEPGQPLWHSGIDASGEVIVELALGDMTGADYQVWTCEK